MVTLALLSLAAVVIRLMTDGGEIQIVCLDPDLKIEIVRDGSDVQEFSVGEMDNYRWFKSGEYEVRIPRTAEDSWEVKNGDFSMSRNGKHVVKIVVAEPGTAERSVHRSDEKDSPDDALSVPEGYVFTSADGWFSALSHAKLLPGGATLHEMKQLNADNMNTAKWQLRDGELSVKHPLSVGPSSLCQLPFAVAGDYEVTCEFTSHRLDAPVFVTLPVGNRLASVMLPAPDAYDELTYPTIDYVNFKPLRFGKGVRLRQDQKHKLHMQVATQDRMWEIQCSIDGEAVGALWGEIDLLSE